MKKVYVLIISLVVIVCGVYLNLSYGRIYNVVSSKNLQSPDKTKAYAIVSNADNKSLVYVSLGDSLTAGVGVNNYEQSYPYLIAEKLSVKNNVILKDRSKVGFKSSDVKDALLPLAISDKPDIVTLLVGINDIRDNVSKDEFKKNYEQIIKSLTQETKAKIYIINIPFIGSDRLILPPYNYYFDYKTNEFNEIIKDIAKENNIQYIDLYSLTKKEFKKSDSYYSADLFHPSAEGYAFWADVIYDNFNK